MSLPHNTMLALTANGWVVVTYLSGPVSLVISTFFMLLLSPLIPESVLMVDIKAHWEGCRC